MNTTVIKVSIYEINEDNNSIRWSLLYDTAMFIPGIRDFEKNIHKVMDMYKGCTFKVVEPYWFEGVYNNVGIIIRGLKIYKVWNKKSKPQYVMLKDTLFKDFIKVV